MVLRENAEEMVAGRTGNEILRTALERAKAEGINATMYTHPLGYHGHPAGPTIGLWDQQGGVPSRGDYELHEDTCYAIELNVKKGVPEWGGQEVRMSFEEDAVFTRGETPLAVRQADTALNSRVIPVQR